MKGLLWGLLVSTTGVVHIHRTTDMVDEKRRICILVNKTRGDRKNDTTFRVKMPPVARVALVVGWPRSGSTALSSALNGHENMIWAGERDARAELGRDDDADRRRPRAPSTRARARGAIPPRRYDALHEFSSTKNKGSKAQARRPGGRRNNLRENFARRARPPSKFRRRCSGPGPDRAAGLRAIRVRRVLGPSARHPAAAAATRPRTVRAAAAPRPTERSGPARRLSGFARRGTASTAPRAGRAEDASVLDKMSDRARDHVRRRAEVAARAVTK